MGFSYYEVFHGALQGDFAIFYQAWYLIAHGHLNPFSTMVGQPFWKDHLATAMWPLATLGLISQSPMVLKVVQDLASAGADLIGALWMLDLVRAEKRKPLTSRVVLAAGIAALALNPWTFNSDAFDFHFYTLSELFLMGSLYAFYKGRRGLGVLLALLICTGGDVNATYAFGAGVSVMLAKPRFWKEGLLVAAASLAIVVSMHAAGAGTGSGISSAYGFLNQGGGSENSVLAIARGIVTNPETVLRVFWDNRLRVYANLGPDGWVGYLSPWAIGPWSALLLENVLYSGAHGVGQSRFSLPGFQFSGGYALLALGTTWIILALGRLFRSERVALVAGAVIGLNALGWAVAWLPHLPETWVRLPVALGRQVEAFDRTPDDVQLEASAGVVGDVAGRALVHQFFGCYSYPVYSKQMRFILTPYSGINVATPEESADTIAQLLDSRAHVIRASNELWVLDYRAPGRGDPPKLPLGIPRPTLPAAAFPTDIGHRVIGSGSGGTSLAVYGDNTAAGFLLRSAYFRRSPGRYRVSIWLRADDPVLIEIRDASKDLFMERQSFRRAALAHFQTDVNLPYAGGDRLFDGYWPFFSPAWRSTVNDALEVRIWAPAHTRAQVQMLGVTGAPQTRC